MRAIGRSRTGRSRARDGPASAAQAVSRRRRGRSERFPPGRRWLSGDSEIVARRRIWHQAASSDAANPIAGFSLWIETALRLRARRTGVHSICQSGMTSVAACRRQAIALPSWRRPNHPNLRSAPRLRCATPGSGSPPASALPRASFLRLGRKQQRIAFASASVRCAGCFGFRHIFCVDGDDTSAAPMSGHHHSQRLVLGHAKFRLQNRDDVTLCRRGL